MEGKIESRIIKRLPSSLRDPAGFIFTLDEDLYRTVNHNHKQNFDLLFKSGLHDHLVNKGWLIEITNASSQFTSNELDVYQVLKIEKLPFISYPHEWCFSQLKTAALFTLELQKIALDYGMTLKDASAFNIQYRGVKPIFIDTLSFEKYEDGSPWSAYEQFCRHFLAPLALMSYRDHRLAQLLRVYMDGIPLDLATELLPFKAFFNLSLLTNIVLQAHAQKWFSNFDPKSVPIVKKNSLHALISNLQSLIEGLKLPKKDSIWKNYYADKCLYTEQAILSKQKIVENLLLKAEPKIVWDLASNDGKFSRIASAHNLYTVSMDFDHNSVESNYLNACKTNDNYLLPLLMDIINPTPAQGWSSHETMSLIGRGPSDTMLALALIHHLMISNSLSLSSIAASFALMCNKLIIEFIPEEDPQLLQLLKSKPIPFFSEQYNIEIFEKEFKEYFVISDLIKIEDSGRIIYFFEKG